MRTEAPRRISRYPDWQSRLISAVAARGATPFCYGAHDCSISPCDLLLAIADMPDPGAPWRGKYRTAGGAIRVMRNYIKATAAFDGWLSDPRQADMPADQLVRWVATARAIELGLSPIPANRAQRGDPVVVRAGVSVPAKGGGFVLGDADCLGLVDMTGEAVYVAGFAGGWAAPPLRNVVAAWRVP